MKPPLQRNVKMQIPPRSAEIASFFKCQRFPENSGAVPAQPELGAALAPA